MKIAIDCRFWRNSGIGTFLENVLAELLTNHKEHKYLLVHQDKIPAFDNQKNIEWLITNVKPFSFKELLCFPTKEINKCDVFYSPYINIPGRIKIPVYSTIHDVLFMDMPFLTSKIGSIIRKLFLKRTIRKSKHIFTVSYFSKERIEHHFGHTIPITVVYNSVSSKIKKENPLSDKKENYFLYVGNVKKHKGLKTLLEAFKAAQNEGLEGRLIIVGNSDNFRTSDNEFSKMLESTNNVTFTGYLSDKKLIDLIRRAKALIQPSLYEGFGLPPIEALYLGTNVIMSNIPVFKELFSDLPVTFFDVNNVNDLKNKLHLSFLRLDVTRIQKIINEKFDVSVEVNRLLNSIHTEYKISPI